MHIITLTVGTYENLIEVVEMTKTMLGAKLNASISCCLGKCVVVFIHL